MHKKLAIIVPRGRVLQSVTGGYRWKGPQTVKIYPNIQYPDTYVDGAPLIYDDPVKRAKDEAERVAKNEEIKAKLEETAARVKEEKVEKLVSDITDSFDNVEVSEETRDTIKPKRKYKKRDTKKIVKTKSEKESEDGPTT